ncbi:MAG: hypothetical protein LUD78_07460 [Clostridiales bacterium]|nr:hypothetical protein [Clostridiales bacterium]
MRGPITTPEQLQERVEYLTGMLHARSDVLGCGVPLLALVVGGCQPGHIHPVLVAACLVGELACVLWFNPWGCLDRCLAPLSRSLLLLSILLVALAAVMAVMDAPIVGVLLVALAAGCVAVALCRRKAWLLAWQVQQSPEVDTVLAHLTHGGEWEPGTVWDNDGCRQTRALLHQALGMECNEDELDRAYKAVYLLAYLSGMEGREAEVERLKKKLAEAEANADQWHSEAINWKSVARYNQDTGNALDRMKQELQEAIQRAQDAEQRAEVAETELSAWRPEGTEESKEAAVLAYLQSGHSYKETGDKFGMSKSQVWRLANEGEGQE